MAQIFNDSRFETISFQKIRYIDRTRLLLTKANKKVNNCFDFSALSIYLNKNRQKFSEKAKNIAKLLNFEIKFYTPIMLTMAEVGLKNTRQQNTTCKAIKGGKIQI